MNKGKSTEQIIQKAKKVDEWRLLSVEERLKHALIKGNIDFIDKDTEEVKKRVSFKVGSAYDIPFEENFFDLVMCGGATSFMDNKNKAVSEYFRVLKPW